MSQKKKIGFLVTGSLIAAAYAGLTFLSNVFGLAYGPIQLRLSEVLALLPVFTPAAIPGLAIGCFLSNLGSFNAADLIFGTLATLLAAVLTYETRKIRFKGIPVLAPLPPIIVNSLVIGAEISLFYLPSAKFGWGFLISALEVGCGELIVCGIFGIPFMILLEKYGLFKGGKKT